MFHEHRKDAYSQLNVMHARGCMFQGKPCFEVTQMSKRSHIWHVGNYRCRKDQKSPVLESHSNVHHTFR